MSLARSSGSMPPTGDPSDWLFVAVESICLLAHDRREVIRSRVEHPLLNIVAPDEASTVRTAGRIQGTPRVEICLRREGRAVVAAQRIDM